MTGPPARTIAGIRPATLLLAALCARLASSPELALFPAGSFLPWWIAGGVALGQELIVAIASRRPGGAPDVSPGRSAVLAHGAALGATLLLLVALQGLRARGASLVVAGMLLGQALPLAPFSGRVLLRSFFARRFAVRSAALESLPGSVPDWVVERLLARVGGSFLALLLVLAALSPRVRGDPWLAAGTLLLLAGSWLGQRRAAASAAAASSSRAGVRRSSSAPATSSTSSSTTEET